MDIYQDDAEGVVDIAKAARELNRAEAMIEPRRRAVVAEITAAALLDIAFSLRPVGQDAAAALAPAVFDDDEPELLEDDGPDLFTVGDLVMVEGYDEPGEIVGFGFDQDEATATVRFSSGAEVKVWLKAVHRLVGDEDDEPDPLAVVDPSDLVDDIDGDFEGDQHPAAASALDVLRANEAARKAAKKTEPKKGKKS